MLSEKPWRLEGLVRFILCLLIGVAVAMITSGLVLHFTGVKPGDQTPLALVLGTLSLDGAILVAVFIFLRLEHLSWADAFGFKTPGFWRALLWGVIVAVCFTPIGQEMNNLCAQALEWFHVDAQNEQAVETLQKAAPGFSRVYLIFFAVVIAPVAEETLFRGILYPTIKQGGFPRAALWGTSILFAAIHLNLSAFLPLVIFAALLAILYEKTNNLLACIIAHSIFNIAGVVLLYHYNPGGPPHS
jgi:membrane protease YdiL (CAAX protease family)